MIKFIQNFFCKINLNHIYNNSLKPGGSYGYVNKTLETGCKTEPDGKHSPYLSIVICFKSVGVLEYAISNFLLRIPKALKILSNLYDKFVSVLISRIAVVSPIKNRFTYITLSFVFISKFPKDETFKLVIESVVLTID